MYGELILVAFSVFGEIEAVEKSIRAKETKEGPGHFIGASGYQAKSEDMFLQLISCNKIHFILPS